MPIDENYWKEYTSMSVFGKENRSFRQPFDLNTKILEDALNSGEISKFKMKHYIDQDGNISVSSIQFEHSEILQGYFLEQKDLLDYGYIELGQEHIVNGAPAFEIKTSAPRIRTTGLSTEKYFPEYVKKLYSKEGKKMPFIEHEGKLYYVPKVEVNASNVKYWTNGKPKPETYQRYNDYGVTDNLAPASEYKAYDNVAYQKLNTKVTESLASDAKFIYDKPEYTNIKEYKFYINDKGEIYLQRTKSPHNYILSQEGSSWFGAGDMNISKPTIIDNQLVGKVYFREAYGKEFMSKQYIMDSLEALYKAENKKFPFKKIGSDYYYVY